MRISDWSSDVCSSDLRDICGHCMAGQLPQLTQGARVREDGRSGIKGEAVLFPDIGSAAGPVAPFDHSGCDTCGLQPDRESQAANACSNDSGLFHFAPSPAAQSPDAVRACPAGDIGFSPDLFMSRATVSDISCGLNGSQGSRKGGGENYVAQKHLRLWRREGATLMIIWRYSRKKGAFMKTSACIPALATVLLITAGTAQAQEASGPPVDPDADTLTVVVGGAYLPSYEGSDDYIASPGALVRGRVAGFSFFTRGASLYVDVLPDHSDSGWDIELGPVANLRLDRNSRIKDPQVRALGKIDKTIELGGWAGITKTGVLTSAYDSLSLRVSYLHDVGNEHDSYIITPSIGYGTPLGTKPDRTSTPLHSRH